MLLLILLLHCFHSFSSSANELQFPTNKNNTHYIANCTILDSDFKVVRILLTSHICLPMSDGSFIATNSTNILKKISPEGEVLWERKGYYHHQLTLSSSANVLALKKVKKKKVLYEELSEIDSNTGQDIKVFSLHQAVQNDKKNLKRLDPSVRINNSYAAVFNTNMEKLHLNSISQFKNEYIINEIDKVSFVLNSEFKFSHFVNLELFNYADPSAAIHDLQKISDTNYIIFKNFNEDPKTHKNTFKIFEFDEKSIKFEFPLNSEDFVQADFSGGIQKIDDTYLIGFPLSATPDSNSFVALISNKGFYLKKSTLPFRIQDIKKIPYDDFMKKNKMK